MSNDATRVSHDDEERIRRTLSNIALDKQELTELKQRVQEQDEMLAALTEERDQLRGDLAIATERVRSLTSLGESTERALDFFRSRYEGARGAVAGLLAAAQKASSEITPPRETASRQEQQTQPAPRQQPLRAVREASGGVSPEKVGRRFGADSRQD